MYVRENVCGILDVVKFEINEVIKLINITVWMQKFLQTLKETFRDRVWFVGLLHLAHNFLATQQTIPGL